MSFYCRVIHREQSWKRAESSYYLPNEILIKILEYACQADGKLKPAKYTRSGGNQTETCRIFNGPTRYQCRLPLVCKRFHDIVTKQHLIFKMNHFLVDDFDILRLFMRTTPEVRLRAIRSLEFKMSTVDDMLRFFTVPPAIFEPFMVFNRLELLTLDFNDTIFFMKQTCHKLMKKRNYQDVLKTMNIKKFRVLYSALEDAKSRSNGRVVWRDSGEPVEEEDMSAVQKEVIGMENDLNGLITPQRHCTG